MRSRSCLPSGRGSGSRQTVRSVSWCASDLTTTSRPTATRQGASAWAATARLRPSLVGSSVPLPTRDGRARPVGVGNSLLLVEAFSLPARVYSERTVRIPLACGLPRGG